MATSPSSPRSVSLQDKIFENARLFAAWTGPAKRRLRIDEALESVDEYETLLHRHTGKRLEDAKVLEIGFGALPLRTTVFHSRGVDATAVDMEVPVLDGSINEYREILRTNGPERLAKSVVRRLTFDRPTWRALERRLAELQLPLRLERDRLLISDAADLDLQAGSLDLITSEDVFEHIAPDELDRIVGKMRGWLTPDGGIALIRPTVFTGITGGHLVEWSRANTPKTHLKRRSEPWEHLRKRRFAPNSYLNELWLRDYRDLFARHGFEIVEEIVKYPDLGRAYFSSDVARELAHVPEEELFANHVMFVLRPHRLEPRRSEDTLGDPVTD